MGGSEGTTEPPLLVLMEPDADQPVEYEYSRVLELYVPPVLLVIGTVGNVLSFIIWTRSCVKVAVSIYIYLAVLSVVDAIVLYLGLFKDWIRRLPGYDGYVPSHWGCKLFTVFGYLFTDYSVWIIIAVTVERYIAVCHPLQSAIMCTVGRAVRIIVAIFVMLLVLNFHLFFTAGRSIVEVNYTDPCSNQTWNYTYIGCGAIAGYERLVHDVWPYVDLCIYSFVPFLVLLVLNCRIIQKACSAATQRRTYTLTSSSDSNDSPARGSQTQSEVRMTIMLLTISFTFLLTTLPMNIMVILTNYWNAHMSLQDCRPQAHAQMQLVATVTKLLMYTNHSVNFYLYCATGNKFRQQLHSLFLCSTKQHTTSTMSTRA